MSKDIVAKTGEYTNREGEKKSEWTKVGVLMSNDNGEYILLDPTINLSGVLQKQNMLADMLAVEQKKAGNEKARTGKAVMCFVFDRDQNQQGGQQQSQQRTQEMPAGGGLVDDDIPFAPYCKGSVV